MNTIDANDLTNPIYSEDAKRILATRAELPIECTLEGMIDFARGILDVPLYEGPYLERLGRFLDEGHRQGPFSQAGHKMLAATFAMIIVQRSRMEAIWAAHPEIADIEIEAPIVIAGLPRSATSNLSGILGSDSRLNSMAFYEIVQQFPSLAELEGRMTLEERAGNWQRGLEEWVTICPLFPTMMDVPFDGTIEELALIHISGCPVLYMNHASTPDWNHWFWNEMDPMEIYQTMKRGLQVVHWHRGNGKRWILKSPHHLAFLSTIDKVFPDANYVITHRDPASSAISNATMISYLYRETHVQPNPRKGFAVARNMADGMLGGLCRDFDGLDRSRVTEVYFHDFMADQLGTLRRVYDGVGLEWTTQAAQEIKSYIETHKRGRHGGRMSYHPERDYGLSRTEIREMDSAYIAKFPVRIEESHA